MVGKLYLNKAVSKRGEREKEKERKEGGREERRKGGDLCGNTAQTS